MYMIHTLAQLHARISAAAYFAQEPLVKAAGLRSLMR